MHPVTTKLSGKSDCICSAVSRKKALPIYSVNANLNFDMATLGFNLAVK